MKKFFPFDLNVAAIEPFDPTVTEDYMNYEHPAGYHSISNDNALEYNANDLKLVAFKLPSERIVKCPMDVKALDLAEGKSVKIIMGGSDITSVVNKETQSYVYYHQPLWTRFALPKVLAGIIMALVSGLIGYIAILILSHMQMSMGRVIAEGLTVFSVASSIIYTLYYFFNRSEGHQKLRQFLKIILK